MFINNFDPVAIQIFSIEIRWYSLAYIFGILLGWLYCKKLLIKDQNISKLFDDLISYLIIGIILGGRLGYVIFYKIQNHSRHHMVYQDDHLYSAVLWYSHIFLYYHHLIGYITNYNQQLLQDI